MRDKWIERKRELPPGIMVVGEKHRAIMDRIKNLGDEDLREIEAFLNFLIDGSESLKDSNNSNLRKIYDFMAGGMERAG